MGFSNWPSYSDGTGTYEDGNVVNKALFDAIKASLEGDIYSGLWPAVTLENLIDEVVIARGGLVGLDTRLDVSINEDGTLKHVAGTVTTEELTNTYNRVEPAPLLNPSFEVWHSDSAAATPWDPTTLEVPDGWEQVTATILNHTVGVGSLGGRHAVEVTNTSTADIGYFYQRIIPETAMSGFMQGWQDGGRKVTFGALVRLETGGADQAQGRLFVDDGVTVTRSANITDPGTVYNLAITHTINSHAKYLRVGVEADPIPMGGSATQIWIGGTYVTFNDVPIPADATPGVAPQRWPYRAGMWHRTGYGERRVASFTGLAHGNVIGSVQTTLWRFHDSVPSYGVQWDDTAIRVMADGVLAQNADANKILRLVVGTHWIDVFNTNSNLADNRWTLRGLIYRTAAATAYFHGLVTYGAAWGAAPTRIHVSQVFAGGAVNWNVTPLIAICGLSATADTVVLQNGVVSLVPLT